MTNQNLNKAMTLTSLLLLAILFQNFDYANLAVPMTPVDAQVRVSHAKELLGKKYNGSFAHKAESIADLHVTIYQDVYKRLPKQYKSQAMDLTHTIITEAEAHDFDPVFVMAVIKTESSFNPKAKGSFGEIGLMQIKPDTAEWIAKKGKLAFHGKSTLENPIENVKIGVAYLNYLRGTFAGYANKYLSAYNMGAKNVRKLYGKSEKPKEYSLRVMKNYKDIYVRMIASRMTTIAEND